MIKKVSPLDEMITKRFTIKDVAEACGVSTGLVSRVINNDEKLVVRDETRQLILDKVKELNYVPDRIAKALRTNKNGIVGMLVIDFTNPFAGELIRGAQQVLTENQKYCLSFETKEDSYIQDNYIRFLVDQGVEGLIIASLKNNDPIIKLLEDNDIKYVMASRKSENAKAPSILYDIYKGTQIAMSHLIKLGHTKIAQITGHLETSPGIMRMKAYKDVLEKNNIEIKDEFIVESNFLVESGGIAVEKLLALDERPSAILACNDIVAISAIQKIEQHKLNVPKDISVVGFHNIFFSQFINPSLTTVNTNTEEVGRLAAKYIVDLINNKDFVVKETLLDVNLIQRSSTGTYTER